MKSSLCQGLRHQFEGFSLRVWSRYRANEGWILKRARLKKDSSISYLSKPIGERASISNISSMMMISDVRRERSRLSIAEGKWKLLQLFEGVLAFLIQFKENHWWTKFTCYRRILLSYRYKNRKCRKVKATALLLFTWLTDFATNKHTN